MFFLIKPSTMKTTLSRWWIIRNSTKTEICFQQKAPSPPGEVYRKTSPATVEVLVQALLFGHGRWFPPPRPRPLSRCSSLCTIISLWIFQLVSEFFLNCSIFLRHRLIPSFGSKKWCKRTEIDIIITDYSNMTSENSGKADVSEF